MWERKVLKVKLIWSSFRLQILLLSIKVERRPPRIGSTRMQCNSASYTLYYTTYFTWQKNFSPFTTALAWLRSILFLKNLQHFYHSHFPQLGWGQFRIRNNLFHLLVWSVVVKLVLQDLNIYLSLSLTSTNICPHRLILNWDQCQCIKG